ncbi:MAG: helix-turn-helix transcriptional regulator [Paludibacteraceae bacterium]|nr:helix-turn-helix transcriptional regulator [Paludibacteraceae bacterium]
MKGTSPQLPHIGQIIRAELDRQGRKQTWLAKQINCDRSNVSDILKRRSIDCEMLWKISKALQVNLFEMYYHNASTSISAEPNHP